MLKNQHNPDAQIEVTGYEIYSDFLLHASEAFSRVKDLDLANIHLIHSDIQKDDAFAKYHLVHAACAFPKSAFESIGKLLQKDKESVCLMPVIRSDGEQDFGIYHLDQNGEMVEKVHIMRSFFTEAKEKVGNEQTSKDTNFNDYFFSSSEEASKDDSPELESQPDFDENKLKHQLNSEKLKKVNDELAVFQDQFKSMVKSNSK